MTPFDMSGKKSLFKTLWEKEKMLLTSIFSFSHNVFYSYQRQISFMLHLFCRLTFNLYKLKFLSSWNGLRKHCGKIRKCWKSAFSPLPTVSSTLPKPNFSYSFSFILSSAKLSIWNCIRFC